MLVVSAALVAALSIATGSLKGGVPWPVVALVVTLGVTLFFPIHRIARWVVDRALYAEIPGYESFAGEVREDLLGSDQVRVVLERIARRMVDALELESADIVLEGEPPGRGLVLAGPRGEEVLQQVLPGLEPTIRGSSDSDLIDLMWRSDSLLGLNLRTPGRRVGFGLFGPKVNGEVFVPEEKRLLSGIAPLLSLALDQSMLSAELRDFNRRLIEAEEAERARLAIDIHDGPLQKAFLLTGRIEGTTGDPRELALDLVGELREITSRLRPSILDDLGLVASLQWLLDGVTKRSDVQTSFSMTGVYEEERFKPEIEVAFFRVTQEAINNVVKHAYAKHLAVSLWKKNGALHLEVDDDGVGVDSRPNEKRGLGLSGMRERMLLVGGSIGIRPRNQRGTIVSAMAPLTVAVQAGDEQ